MQLADGPTLPPSEDMLIQVAYSMIKLICIDLVVAHSLQIRAKEHCFTDEIDYMPCTAQACV
jgi:hypothetical protein